MAKQAKISHAEPMLATLIEKPFNDPDWLYEVKWDGFRIISHLSKRNVTLRSRKGENYTKKYLPVVEALQKLNIDAILDGELIAIDPTGKPNFDEVQRWDGFLPLQYYLFDIISLDGKSLIDKPLTARKDILRKIIPEDHDILKFSDSFDDGIALFNQLEALDWEGIIAKRKDSIYQPGKRTKNWLKIPTRKQQEFVVGGWAESTSGRPFRTLIFGYYENNKLVYQGHAGGGFKEKDMPAIFQRLKKLETKKSPFANTDVLLKYAETPVHWVKPELVIQVKYATTTRSGMIRKPASFLGFREDKNPKEVVLEKPEKAETTLAKQANSKPLKTKNQHLTTTSEASNWPTIESIPITSEDTFNIEGNKMKLTNVEKELWKGVTKADLISYYHHIAPYMLPHLQGRPLSLHIKHIKPTVEGLYIKDIEGRQPSWAEIFNTKRKHKKEGARDEIDYLVCNEEATLLWLVNLGCIDINPWTSHVGNPEQPDYIIIDLDPTDEDFGKAVTAAMAAQEYFKTHKLKAFPKTSGKTGMHLYIPCRNIDFPLARAIAEHICNEIHQLAPKITTTSVSINSRGNKLYLDPNQNDYADTVAAPYSVRPHKLPTVSTPLEWKEIKPGLDPHAFTMAAVQKRLEKKGDLFAGALDEKVAVLNSKKILTLT
jgi:bifunctional non-homologous end joining protein LigD